MVKNQTITLDCTCLDYFFQENEIKQADPQSPVALMEHVEESLKPPLDEPLEEPCEDLDVDRPPELLTLTSDTNTSLMEQSACSDNSYVKCELPSASSFRGADSLSDFHRRAPSEFRLVKKIWTVTLLFLILAASNSDYL